MAQPTKPVRQSNLELLRIVAMLAIVMHHSIAHGMFPSNNPKINAPGLVNIELTALASLGTTGVTAFVIITGYFTVTSTFNLKKLVKLLATSWSIAYPMSILGIALLGYAYFTKIQLVSAVLPLLMGQYWFVSAFVALMLLSPFLNALCHAMTSRQHLTLIVISLTMFYVVPTFVLESYFKPTDIMRFVIIYIVGAFLRLHPNDLSRRTWAWLAVASLVLLEGTILVFQILGLTVDSFFSSNAGHFSQEEIIFVMFVAVSTFELFRRLDIKPSPFINSVSATTFGIYLLHDNAFFRDYLWFHLLHTKQMVDSPFVVPYVLGVTVLVFSVASAVEWLRLRFVQAPAERLVGGTFARLSFLGRWYTQAETALLRNLETRKARSPQA